MLEYIFGTFRTNLYNIVKEQRKSFLLPVELTEYETYSDSEEKLQFLKYKVEPRLDPLWYLVVSLCRCLQEGENSLNAEDAYWLGLLDEAVGTSLPCYRMMFEPIPDELESTVE